MSTPHTPESLGYEQLSEMLSSQIGFGTLPEQEQRAIVAEQEDIRQLVNQERQNAENAGKEDMILPQPLEKRIAKLFALKADLIGGVRSDKKRYSDVLEKNQLQREQEPLTAEEQSVVGQIIEAMRERGSKVIEWLQSQLKRDDKQQEAFVRSTEEAEAIEEQYKKLRGGSDS